jgi:hypothetical protein
MKGIKTMKTLPNNRLAILRADWKQFLSKPVSLLEIMREFIAFKICIWDEWLNYLDEITSKRKGAVLTKKEKKEILSALDGFIGNPFEEMGWKDAATRAHDLGTYLTFTEKLTAASANNAIYELRQAIRKELNARKFVMIENEKSEFFEDNNLFGERVGKSFPAAKDEIQAAGNCMAMNLNTAAVFHLMRVVETAMRALVVHLRIKIKNKTIKEAGWDELIKLIEKNIKERREKYDSVKRKKRSDWNDLKFYGVAADELKVFKENWRDKVMHTWSPYNEYDAHSVFVRVRDFMQRLSTKVSEINN